MERTGLGDPGLWLVSSVYNAAYRVALVADVPGAMPGAREFVEPFERRNAELADLLRSLQPCPLVSEAVRAAEQAALPS